MKLWAIGGCIVLVSIGCSAQPRQQVAPEGSAASDARLAELTKSQLDAAEKLVAAIQEREDAGEALTPGFLILRRDARKSVLRSKLALARNAEERLAAGREYVKLSQSATRIFGRDVSFIRAIAEHDLAEARVIMAQIECANLDPVGVP